MRKNKKRIGLPPGSIVFTGSKKVEQVFVHYLQYDETDLKEETFDTHKEINVHDSPDEKVDWYDVRGLHDIELIEFLGKKFDLHPLILEDIADTYQRPKFEEYEKGNFIIFKALSFDKTKMTIQKTVERRLLAHNVSCNCRDVAVARHGQLHLVKCFFYFI